MSDPEISVSISADYTEIATLIRPTDPSQCTPVLLTFVPELGGYALTQLEPGARHPDVITLTAEMAQQIASIIPTGLLPSSIESIPTLVQ